MEESYTNNKRPNSNTHHPQRKRVSKTPKRRGTRGKTELLELHHESNSLEAKPTINDSLVGTELLIIDDQSPITSEIESKAKYCQATISKTFHAGISHIVFPHSASNTIELFKSFYAIISNQLPTIKLLPFMDNDFKYGSSILLCFFWPNEIIPQEVFVVSQFWVQDCYLRSYRPPESNYISAIFCSLFPKTLRKAMHYNLENPRSYQLNRNNTQTETSLHKPFEFSEHSQNSYNNEQNQVEMKITDPQDKINLSSKVDDLEINSSNQIFEKDPPDFDNSYNILLTETHESDTLSLNFSNDALEKVKTEPEESESPTNNLELSTSVPIESNNASSETSSKLNVNYSSKKENVNTKNFTIDYTTPTSTATNTEENTSFIEMERNRPESEIEVPRVGDWVETKSNHEDSQIFKAKVLSSWQISGTWMFRLKSPDIVSTYVEPLKNVRVENIWSNNLLLDLGRGRKSRRSSKSLCTNDTYIFPHNRCTRSSEGLHLDDKISTIENENKVYETKDPNSNEKENFMNDSTLETQETEIDNVKLIKDEIEDSCSVAKSTSSRISQIGDKDTLNSTKGSISESENDGEKQNILNLNPSPSKVDPLTKYPNKITRSCYSDESHNTLPMKQGIEIIGIERELTLKPNLNARLNGHFRVIILEDALKCDETSTLKKIFDYVNQNLPSPFNLDNHKYFMCSRTKELASELLD